MAGAVAWQLMHSDGTPSDRIRLTPPIDETETWRALYPMYDDLTPPEALASHLIDVWIADKGSKIPWQKAVQITAIVTKMPDAERDSLLALGQEE